MKVFFFLLSSLFIFSSVATAQTPAVLTTTNKVRQADMTPDEKKAYLRGVRHGKATVTQEGYRPAGPLDEYTATETAVYFQGVARGKDLAKGNTVKKGGKKIKKKSNGKKARKHMIKTLKKRAGKCGVGAQSLREFRKGSR